MTESQELMKPTTSAPPPTTPSDDHDSLVDLAFSDAFAPMRWLDRFGEKVSPSVRSDQTVAALQAAPRAHVLREGGKALGGLLWNPIPDLAEHFDLPVHEVTAVFASPAVDRQPVMTELLGALRSDLADHRGGFVMLRLEADDLAGFAAATESGFRLASTSLSLVNDLERRHLNPPYDPQGMRVHRFDDGPLPEKLHSELSSAPTPLVDDHYHADPRLDNERCTALYDRKRDRVIEGIGADVMVYREVDDIILGFGTFKRATELEPYGISLLDGSFGYRPPGAPAGNNRAAAAFMCNENLLDNRLVEWDTQATNFGMVNMLAGRPSIRLVRSSYMLHCWTDEL